MGHIGEFFLATINDFFFFFLLFVLAFFLSYCWDHITVLDRTPASAAAASCPSCSDSGFRYDVFISFRGPDTRNGFTSHLFYTLRRAKIRPFMDHDLEKGEEISRGLSHAIERSKILVVVLSENYASSTWCLDELAKIMECRRRGHRVLPVFYGVKPREVRRQTGRYEADLAMHQNGSREKGMAEKVKRWRDALTEAASLFGYDSDVVSPEGKLVNDMVDDILEMLQNPSITPPSSQTVTPNRFGRTNEVRYPRNEIAAGEREDTPPPLSERVKQLDQEQRQEERRATQELAAAIACLAEKFSVAKTLLRFVEDATTLERCRDTSLRSESVLLRCN